MWNRGIPQTRFHENETVTLNVSFPLTDKEPEREKSPVHHHHTSGRRYVVTWDIAVTVE